MICFAKNLSKNKIDDANGGLAEYLALANLCVLELEPLSGNFLVLSPDSYNDLVYFSQHMSYVQYMTVLFIST